MLAALGLSRLLPEHGVGLFLRLGAATLVVLLPGGLIARALGLRTVAATLAWALAALGGGARRRLPRARVVRARPVAPARRHGDRARSCRRASSSRRSRDAGSRSGAGLVLGVLLWHVAPRALAGDSPFHLARVRKLVELGSLHARGGWTSSSEAGCIPATPFRSGMRSSPRCRSSRASTPRSSSSTRARCSCRSRSSIAFEAGTRSSARRRSAPPPPRRRWRSSRSRRATAARIRCSRGRRRRRGSCSCRPCSRSSSRTCARLATPLLVERRRRLGGARARPSDVRGVPLHPARGLARRPRCSPSRARAWRIGAALAAVGVPTAAVALALLPLARDTVSHAPSSVELRRSLAHYRDQLVVHGVELPPRAGGLRAERRRCGRRARARSARGARRGGAAGRRSCSAARSRCSR